MGNTVDKLESCVVFDFVPAFISKEINDRGYSITNLKITVNILLKKYISQ